MSSAAIITAMTATLTGMSDFGSTDVVTDDWSILDRVGSHETSPYFMWHVPDTFVSRRDNFTTSTIWEIEGELIHRFVKWPTTKAAFDVTRQNILDEFNQVGSDRFPAAQTDIQEIRSNSPVEFVYDISAFDNQGVILPEALPMWISQRFLFIIQEGFD